MMIFGNGNRPRSRTELAVDIQENVEALVFPRREKDTSTGSPDWVRCT